MYAPIPSVISSVGEKGGTLLLKMQIKITKGYRREAIERYKHDTTYVAIFPVLGRNE